MELENSRPTAADRGENSRTPQGRKEKTRRGRKNGEETGETRAFSSISSPFFVFSSLLSLLTLGKTQCRWGRTRNILSLFSTHFNEGRTFFGAGAKKIVQLSLEVQNIVCIFALWMSLRRVAVITPRTVTTKPRTSIAPHSADRRAHPGRTPTGPNGVARAAPLLLKNAPESSPERHWA